MVQHPPERRGTPRADARPWSTASPSRSRWWPPTRLRLAGRDPGAALPWAYGIVGLVHQAGDWWVDDQTMTRDALVDDLVTLLWDGLGSSPASGSGGA